MHAELRSPMLAHMALALTLKWHGTEIVLMIDKCPEEWAGGNGYFTEGAHRTVHNGLHDLLSLLETPLPAAEVERIDVEPYTADAFAEDIQRLGGGRADPEMVRGVVANSREAVGWLRERIGAPFSLSFNRQAYEVDGRMIFWGGMSLSMIGGGKSLIAKHRKALKKDGVEVWFEARAIELLMDGEEICGAVVDRVGKKTRVKARSVVLAAGGFEANAEKRIKHLGKNWEQAHVRGTPYNTGDGFELAHAVGAKFAGDWGGCHSTAWDANAPRWGERVRTNTYTKSGYPLGLMVNLVGHRFVDEGEDFRNFTYAKFGRAILEQPGGYAFQVWDAKVTGRLRKEEYGEGIVEKIWAQSIEELAEKLVDWGLEDQQQFVDTLHTYNAATKGNLDGWNPAVKDGLRTHKPLEVPKTNWALPLDSPPFMAVKVTCGITFTFGGLAIDPQTAAVMSAATNKPIPGLFCTGEMVGGVFYGNYPGGSGLTSGAVFGRKAGMGAGARLSNRKQKRDVTV
ncbi:hypothetical protein NLJ89_g2875 [Agrocybe chaxingu]|uniref:FAD-dependent oxidoreductase 2 FAD-binding domain-containing protein n=1 Tax=Agrocybe chaxingu TaxID=84603 RepID=A0A9W8MXC1_9AGAR|nr:hypothetical protein NLJ89_g2875 [Agrocybe chaxingu]